MSGPDFDRYLSRVTLKSSQVKFSPVEIKEHVSNMDMGTPALAVTVINSFRKKQPTRDIVPG